MKKKFEAYCDPAHGWVKVEKAILKELGIADKITHFSYQLGEFAYLEEDCDLTMFIRTFVGKYGFEPAFKDNYSNKSSKIRTYESYRYLTDEQEKELADLKKRMLAYGNWNKTTIRKIHNAGLDTMHFWANAYGF